jgi:hypothetical protein
MGPSKRSEVGAVISGDHVQEMPSERAELHAVDHACARSGLDRPRRRKSAPAPPSEFREVGLPLIMALDCRRPWIRTSPTSINAFLGWSTIRGVANEPNLLKNTSVSPLEYFPQSISASISLILKL